MYFNTVLSSLTGTNSAQKVDLHLLIESRVTRLIRLSHRAPLYLCTYSQTGKYHVVEKTTSASLDWK